MTAISPEAANVLTKPPEVEVKEEVLSFAPETLHIPPLSIAVYRFPGSVAATAHKLTKLKILNLRQTEDK